MLIYGSPFRYYQGYGILDDVGKTLAPMGKVFLLVGDDVVFDLFGDRIERSFAQANRISVRGVFNGESSDAQIDRLSALCAQHGCDAVVGIGGGKAADTAKGVSIKLDTPVAIVPTLASSDAAISHVAMIYKEDHSKDRVAFMRYAPWCIFVDTEVILRAPLRLLVSGIGDAAATKFEADACRRSGAKNLMRGTPPKTAQALCDVCWEIIRTQSLAAIDAVRTGQTSQAFEDVVEAATLLSGLGFENGGLAAAHAVSNGLTLLPSVQRSTHGEMVAFGLIVQCVLEERPPEFMRDMLDFLQAVGLPLTLEALGLNEEDALRIPHMAEKICTPRDIIFNMPCAITPHIVEKAIREADRIGRQHSPGM